MNAACATLALSTLSCGESSTSESADVARIEATPSSLALLTDESKSVAARAVDAAGTSLARPLFWSVSNPSVVTVTQAGSVTGVSPGTAKLAASSSGKSVVIPVTVAERPVALVRVTPATSTIRVGTTTPLATQLLDATGATLSGRAIQWSSASATVASVSSAGLVTGLSPGSATIAASSGGVSGTALVSVQPVPVATLVMTPTTAALLDGALLSLTVAVRDSAGRVLTGRAVAWSTNAPTIANVSSTGAVLAIAPGTATITATSEGKTAVCRVTISAVPVATITVSPATATIAVGQTAPLVARVADSTGALLNGRTVRWTSDKPAAAGIDATTGVVTALATGQARITATSEGKTGTAVVTVATVPVASIQVTPASATMLAGESQRLTTRLLDAQGNALTGRAVTWIGGAPAVASVDSTGLVRAVATGAAVIVALSEGARASVPITVAPITVAKVTVSPATGSVEIGRTLQLTASITDIRGRPIAGKVATWTTSNTSVATVTSTGRLQAITPGTVTMSAKSDAVVGAATLTVTLVRVGRITVLPTTTVLFTGRTLPLVVQLADSLGNPLSTTGRTVTWASAVPAIATVDAIGVATTITPGTVAISATSDGKSASAILTVNAMPVSSVSVRPDTALLSTGNVVQLTATAFDAGGSVIPGRLATWSLSDATVASVDATGQVSGLAPGAVRVTATIDGMQGSATVVVSAIPVSSVTISPPTPTLTVGSTLALSATLYGPAPNVVLSPVGRTVTWSVASGGVASISGAGVVTALSAGTTTVTVSAVSPGQLSPVTATVSLTVTP